MRREEEEGGGRWKEGREKDRRREKGGGRRERGRKEGRGKGGRREGGSFPNVMFIRFSEHRSSETFISKGSVSPDPFFIRSNFEFD